MKKRKLELALVFLAVAVAALLLGEAPAPENSIVREPAQQKTSGTLDVSVPKVELSEDAKWIITTAADSYSPRVKVEKTWQESEDEPAKTEPARKP